MPRASAVCSCRDFELDQDRAVFHFLRYLLIPAKNHVVTDFGAKAATVMRVLTVSAEMVEKLQNLLSQVRGEL